MSPSEPFTFDYSPTFSEMVRELLRGKESWERYPVYVEHHLGGLGSRLSYFVSSLCPEMELRCGPLTDQRVLDFGCGSGATTAALAMRAREVVGFDIHPLSLRLNRQRLKEHGLESKVRLVEASDFQQVVGDLGHFDLILVNDVLEHVPLSVPGLRERLVQTLFDLLNPGGVLYFNQSPNRLWPRDVHTTGLAWVHWAPPGSAWAYRRAVKKGKHADNADTHSPGPLGLEERGAWGITFFELRGYLAERPHEVLNCSPGQDREVSLLAPAKSWKRRLYDRLLYHGFCRWTGVPLVAFSPMILHLAFRKLPGDPKP
jgi:2-polyprenyl-3-methyl-5-hydroxy-6-metoxy-1,4-benzoquinol methylase